MNKTNVGHTSKRLNLRRRSSPVSPIAPHPLIIVFVGCRLKLSEHIRSIFQIQQPESVKDYLKKRLTTIISSAREPFMLAIVVENNSKCCYDNEKNNRYQEINVFGRNFCRSSENKRDKQQKDQQNSNDL
jgi:hypothetical protein